MQGFVKDIELKELRHYKKGLNLRISGERITLITSRSKLVMDGVREKFYLKVDVEVWTGKKLWSRGNEISGRIHPLTHCSHG